MTNSSVVSNEAVDPPAASAGEARRRFTHALRAAYVATTLAALTYLSGDALVAAKFAMFVFGIVFPAAALVARLRSLRNLEPSGRVVFCLTLALVACTPCYYLRRLAPGGPNVADLAAMGGLLLVAIRGNAYRDWLADLSCPALRVAAPWLFLAIPVLFAAVWSGSELVGADSVGFVRMYPQDFWCLTTCVTMIKDSPGAPLQNISGLGYWDYHWFYFTLPAWISEFLYGDGRNCNAQILANLLTSWLLYLAAFEAARCAGAGPSTADRASGANAPAPASSPRLASAAAATVMFAGMITLLVPVAVEKFGWPWPRMLDANFVTVVKSMAFFTNNAAAVCCALVAVLSIGWWNDGRGGLFLAAASLLVTMTVSLSATLFPGLLLGCGLCWLVGGMRSRLPSLLVGGATVGIGIYLFKKIHLLGDRPGKVEYVFDRGMFLHNLLVGLAPLVVLIVVSGTRPRRLTLFHLVAIGAILEGSFFQLNGLHTDFTQKTAVLVLFALTPLVAESVHRLFQQGWSWRAAVASGAVALGLLNSLMFAGQFPLYRLGLPSSPTVELRRAHYDALLFVRRHTPRDAIVIDSESCPVAWMDPTADLAERIAYLPSSVDDPLPRSPLSPAQLADLDARLQRYADWQSSNFADAELSKSFAREGDYLVLPAELTGESLAPWREVARFDTVRVYRSLAR